MAGLIRKNIDSPDEVRPFEDDTGELSLVDLDGALVGKAVFKPGWRWSVNVKPIAKTDSCMAAHVGFVVSGRLVIVMDDGEQNQFGPGDFMKCPPGHDAWVAGDKPCVVIDWQGYADYAKR